MPTLEPAPVVELRDLGQTGPDPPSGSAPQSDLRIAVFDGGVDLAAPQLTPFVKSTDLTDEPPLPEYLNHGTIVTASVLYGADHGDGGTLATPEVGVDHFRVLPAPKDPVFDLDLVSVLEKIETEVTEGGYKIVNLSIGPRIALEEDQEPHAWTARLDALAERRGVLFMTAVGNDGDADPASGAHRIQVPSDMVNGIGVGACDARRSHLTWARAPYSSIGPGRSGARMQPTGVAFGGVVPMRPFRGIGAGGRILSTAGTSFATPTATHGLSALAAQLRPEDWDPSVLRVFAAQYAEAPTGDPLHEEVGFGRLVERYDGVLECEPNEATILYRDEVERGKMISLPLPLPVDALLGRKVTLSWSIAFASPTDPKNPIDYTQASLEAKFRPHAGRHRFSKEKMKPKVVNLDLEREHAAQLLAEGYAQSGLPVSDGYRPMRPEGLRRSEDGKWETMLRASKTKQAAKLLRPQITVLYLARQDGDLAPGPPLQFAMLANLRAAPGVPLYDAIRSQYPVLNPIRTQLPVRLTT